MLFLVLVEALPQTRPGGIGQGAGGEQFVDGVDELTIRRIKCLEAIERFLLGISE